MTKSTLVLSLVLMALLAAGSFLADENDAMTGEDINWQVVSGGGTDGTSTNYKLGGTVGQTSTGHGSSTNYEIRHGYCRISAFYACRVMPMEAVLSTSMM